MFPLRDHNPSRRTPFVTWGLIAINVAVFLAYARLLGDDAALMRLFGDWAMIPARITAGDGYATILTSMFLHGGIMHIIGNMLFLFIFGDNMEDSFGHAGFLAFYLAAGVLAALAHVLADPASPVPTVGASGAIAGVMGGYLLLFPKARVDVLVILVVIVRMFALPAWIVLGAWFALQILSGASTQGVGGGVAYWAHAGGFLAGLALTLPTFLRRGAQGFWRRTEGHPPHAPTAATLVRTRIPPVLRRR
jgi:membrane associated rhomboid family serine protease